MVQWPYHCTLAANLTGTDRLNLFLPESRDKPGDNPFKPSPPYSPRYIKKLSHPLIHSSHKRMANFTHIIQKFSFKKNKIKIV